MESQSQLEKLIGQLTNINSDELDPIVKTKLVGIVQKLIPESFEGYYQSLFSQAPVGICITDYEGRFYNMNAAFCKLVKRSEEDLYGMLAFEMYQDAKDRNRLISEIKEKKQVENYYVSILTGNKEVTWVSINMQMIELNGQELLFSIMLDRTVEKQIAEELADSESRLRALSDATYEALFFSDKGICIDCNAPASRMFGYKHEELIGIFGTDVIADESKETVKNNMMSGYELPYEALAQRKDGSKFWGEFQGKMYDYNGQKVRVTAVRNISLRKEAQIELEKYRQHLESLVKERTKELEQKNKELEHFNNLFIGREYRIKELKDQLKILQEKLSNPFFDE